MLQIDRLIVRKYLLVAGLFCCVTMSIAQPPANKPSAATQSPAPAGQVATRPADYSPEIKVNFIRSWDALGPYQTEQDLLAAGYQHVKQATQYFDGLGRPLQTVARQASPGSSPKDLVAPVVYDEFGREIFKYLPYVQSNNITDDGKFKLSVFTDQDHFYKNVYKDASNNLMYAGEQVLYGRTEFEASPLNRVVKSFAPGNSWAGSYNPSNPGSEKGIGQQYLINTANDAVRIWDISNNALTYNNNDVTTNIPGSNNPYNAGELYKNVIIDEQGNAVVEYKDKEGKVILKKVQSGDIATDYSGYTGFLCTYYIYDDLNRLRFVIPPKAVEAIKVNWAFTTDIINELCFRYEYDSRQRMIAKKVPGAGWVYLVYDTRDRLVFTQDANLRNNNRWMATLYDGLNRPVLTGMIIYTGNPLALQTAVTTQTATPSNPNTSMPVDKILPDANTSGTHQALRSVNMIDAFETTNGGEFIAEIIAGPGGADGETTVIEGMAVNKNPLPPGSTLTALTMSYYDDYGWTNKTYNTSWNAQLDAGNNLHAETMPAEANGQVLGMVTGTGIRVIEDPNNLSVGSWLTTVSFYDQKGRVIQVQSDNYKGGTDIVTNRYDFTGKVLSSYQVHNNPAATQVRIKTNLEYDYAGRLLETWKTINDETAKKALIAKNEYDELGQLKKKELGKKKDINGNYTSEPIEKLDYTYNIRGWLKGINKYYANKGTTETDRWFGMELDYDWGFQNNQYNGNIAGTKWRSKGDGEQRAYGFGYDKMNRLLSGDFSQYEGSGYADNAVINFDMQMGDGQTASSAYDENGNIKGMKQWGLKIGGSTQIDDLNYSYYANTNKLMAVTEQGTGTTDHKLGDFTDKNTSGIDYGYDLNGNLITDLNKGLNGALGSNINASGGEGAIRYNHLNLPAEIVVAGKGMIYYTYDAAGNKLKKMVVEDATAANNNISTTTTTLYIGGFVYESKTDNNMQTTDYSDKLQFFGHEEGRARPLYGNASSPATVTGFVYDYMIKDHLGNVRMVLTEEQQMDIYPASTLEGSQVTTDKSMLNYEKKFYTIDNNFITDKTAISTWTLDLNYENNNGNPPPNNSYPADHTVNSTATSDKLYKLNATANKTGLGLVIKVMAGDKVDIHGKSYYHSTQTFTNNNSTQLVLTDIINAFLETPNNAGAAKGVTSSQMEGWNAGSIPGDFIRGSNGETTAIPKAYINFLFFDEQFKYAGTGGASRVGGSGEVKRHWFTDGILQNITAPKNGYLYVYVSNESNVDVFFDNLQVMHTRGPLLEETHYYPFGLTMAGISSKALAFGKENKRKFNQGTELNTDFDINLYETNYRSLDPQLGRFWQIDPLAESHPNLTSYSFVGNNPLRYNDPFGLDTIPTVVKNGKMNVPGNPNQNDVLKIDNGDGTNSFYNYDPNNPAANSQGYVGAGIDGGTGEEAKVTATKKSSGTNVPIWFDGGVVGGEYRLGKVLDKYASDGYGRGRPFWPGPRQRVFDRNFPKGSFANVRPVNIHIPGTGSSIQVPRYIVSSTGQVLKFVGATTAVIGTISTEVRYANGEISNANRWTNHIMTGVAFLPGGVVVSLLYSAVFEDMIFKGKVPNLYSGAFGEDGKGLGPMVPL